MASSRRAGGAALVFFARARKRAAPKSPRRGIGTDMANLLRHVESEPRRFGNPGRVTPSGTWYYIIFSAAIFLRGRARILMLSALLLAAGPGICIMLPLWLLGAGVFWLCSKDALAPRSG